MSSGQNASRRFIACAVLAVAAAFCMLAIFARTVGAAPGSGRNDGALPDLTKTPVYAPPAPPGWPTATPTAKTTESPCEICYPGQTPDATSSPTYTPESESTWTPLPTLTQIREPASPTPTMPPGGMTPLAIRPVLQFGHSQPGDLITYSQRVSNNSGSPQAVLLRGESLANWPVMVAPDTVTAGTGSAVAISVTVGVPFSTASLFDVERVESSVGSSGATGYLVTLVGRHPFIDLSPDHWADNSVQYLTGRGIVSGYEDGSFRPDDDVTRAQFAKMLVIAMGWDTSRPGTPAFWDVPTGHWAYKYIEAAAAHGIIEGYSDGTFRPDGRVLRAQVAKMITLARGWETDASPMESAFTDVRPGDWSASYIETASRAGIISGYADHTFRPYRTASRAQIAKILTISLFSDPEN